MWATGEAASAPAFGPETGATLLEMLVVVALMGLIGGLVFANARPAMERATLEAARVELASTLDQARARALRTSTPQTVELARDGSGYASDGRVVRLARGVRIESEAAQVAFSANGLSAGTELAVARAGRRLAIRVAPGGEVSMTGPG